SEIRQAMRTGHRRRSHVTPGRHSRAPSRGIARPPSLGTSIVVSLPLAPARRGFRPVIGVRAAKSAISGNHFLHAHLVGWDGAIVRKCPAAPVRARAPRTLNGLADAKVEQHCRGHRNYDENEAHRSSPDADLSGWCTAAAIWQLIQAERN